MTDISESARRAKAALEKKVAAPVPQATDFVSTGLTTLNLACSGRALGGLQKGHIYRLIGKSQTGKTFLGGSILCEAAINPAFKGYVLRHRDIEFGAKMDPNKFWPPLVPRLVSPLMGNYTPPKTLNEWFAETHAELKAGKRIVSIEDSLDVLGEPDAEGKMSDGRAKWLSQNMRKLVPLIQKTGSIMVLVQHAKVNMGNTWAELVTTGGASPEFYSTLDIWLSKCETLKKKYKENDFAVGVVFQAHVRKNRTNGVDRSLRFPLYYEYGIDDIGACIWMLLEYGHWKRASEASADEPQELDKNGKPKKKRAGTLIAPEFNHEGSQADLVKIIESQDSKLHDLRMLTSKVWRQVEAALSQGRKPRYT